MTPYERKVLRVALRVAERALTYEGHVIDSPQASRDYLRLWAAGRTEEAFGVIWLNAGHRVLAVQELFHGSIDSASVYPRVVVKRALEHNASAALLFHNHPGGSSEPSRRDVDHPAQGSAGPVEVRARHDRGRPGPAHPACGCLGRSPPCPATQEPGARLAHRCRSAAKCARRSVCLALPARGGYLCRVRSSPLSACT